MPKALIITYYWPPAGGSGVQRWLKFVKYFRDFGWEPIVYTALNPEAPVYDDTLFKDIPEGISILHKSVPEPYRLYKKISGKKDEKIGVGFTSSTKRNSGVIQKIAVWIRGNLFIPDARMFWIKPSIKYLSQYLSDNHVDIIVSTGPPHSTHLIARGLKRKFNIPWLADFRDPWTNIDFYKDLKLTRIVDIIHHRLEKSVLLESDLVTTVSKSMANEFGQLREHQVYVIPNGFDHQDFVSETTTSLDELFTINYFGIVPPSRNCPKLWLAIKMLIENNPSIANKMQVNFYGQVDHSIKEEIKNIGLAKYFVFNDFVSHAQVAELQKKSQALLLLVNNSPNSAGIVTGKVFEYLAAKRPILALGPIGGDLDELIKETKAGKMLSFDDEDSIFEGLKWFWDGYMNSWREFNPQSSESYSRKELTRKIVSLMDKIIYKK